MEETKKKSRAYKLSALAFKLSVAIACLLYIIKCGRNIKPDDLKLEFIPAVLVAAFAYFLATFIMVYGWRTCQITLANKKKEFLLFAKIYFCSAPAKYLPSNIMHFAARHYQTIQAGYDHTSVAASNILENIFITISACIVICFGIISGQLTFPTDFLNQNLKPTYLIIAMVIVTTALAILSGKCLKNSSLSSTAIMIIKVLTGYIIFLFITSFIFLLIMNIAVPQDLTAIWPRIIFTYICAWTIGLITPGAPGGLGVRESAIVYLTSDILTNDQALLGALLFRLVTIGGEIIGYYYARFLK